MYRIDGIADRIQLEAIENDNSLNKYREASEKLQLDAFTTLFQDFRNPQSQLKVHRLINNPKLIQELGIIFKLIDKNLIIERREQEKGIATHLLGILMNNLTSYSIELWRKIALIIGDPQYEETLTGLNIILKRQCAMTRMSSVIEEYLKSLCELDDGFLVDVEVEVEAVHDEKKFNLFRSLSVAQMILIIHHLLNLPETSKFFADKIFGTFDLSENFLSFLKLSLRNLNL